MENKDYIIGYDDAILITGASGFIGSKVVEKLVSYGFTNLRCLVRSTIVPRSLKKTVDSSPDTKISIVNGDLLSIEDCKRVVAGVRVIYHLAASTQDKSFPDAYKHSVDATRNLLNGVLGATKLARFVNVSSFSVYSNLKLQPGALLDESCPIEDEPELRGEAYSYGKIKQEDLIREYGKEHEISYVIIRPGAVYGPGSLAITGRVGIPLPGVFLHLGGSNIIPFTYVDNCAEAIILAGIIRGIDGEAINVVDDGLLTSGEFLRLYKRNVMKLRSVSLPKALSFLVYCLLGIALTLLRGGAPTKYNRRRWSAYWKGNTYTNSKVKKLLGWTPEVSLEEGMDRYFAYCKRSGEYDA